MNFKKDFSDVPDTKYDYSPTSSVQLSKYNTGLKVIRS